MAAEIIIPAAISAVSSLFGSKKGSDAAKASARIQSNAAQMALDEQRRVYDLEQAEERRKRSARRDIFGRYGIQQPEEPPYVGPSDTVVDPDAQRPSPGGQPLPGGRPSPSGRPMRQSLDLAMSSNTPQFAGEMVTLQAPTGEVTDVPIAQASALIAKGAIVLPKQSRRNAFGWAYGMV